MSQLNTANTSSPNNYALGRGKLYFSALVNSLPSGGWRDLGNCPTFTINSEEETLEHKSSRSGLAVVDKKLTISRTTNISFDLDELTFDNLADWFSGDAVADAYSIDLDLTDSNLLTATNYVANKWYEMKTPGGARIYELDQGSTSYIIEQTNPSDATLTAGTDYLIDEEAGLIMILSTGAANPALDDIKLTVTGGLTATMDEVRAFAQGSVTGALKFVAINPANNDAVREFQFHQVTLASDGDLSLIGDEFSTMSFTGVVESNTVADADSPFVTIRGAGSTFV